MKLIDTHCHLYGKAFSEDIDAVLDRAASAGVERFYLPAIDAESEPALLKLEKAHPGVCFAMQGLHPCSVKEDVEKELQRVEQSLASRRFVAVGEIGLDFYWDRTFETEQYDAFSRQIGWALQYDIPIVIHCRDSMRESIDVVRKHQNGRLRGIFHCFNETEALAREIIDLGFYLGIGGVLTYKNSGLSASLRYISLKHMVLETDAPYLPPVPFRGKRNESSYLTYVAAALALLKGVSPSEVGEITSANALKIFGL